MSFPAERSKAPIDGRMLLLLSTNKEWIGKDFPRVIIVEIQHANPYYDDSYAVNSANLGP